MKSTDIQIQLKNYKIRGGYLMKRSRVLRQWRKRFMVLTINFLFSFESQECDKVTQVIDLKEIVSYRSYLKNSEQSQPNCFFIQTKATDFAFSPKEANEKWSWIVTLERLFDFKQRGASSYNNIDMIKTQGFESQNQFELMQRSKLKSARKIICSPDKDKPKQFKANEILDKLMEHQQILNKRQLDLIRKQKQLEKVQLASSQCIGVAEKLSKRVKQLEQEIEEFKAISLSNKTSSIEIKAEKDINSQVQGIKMSVQNAEIAQSRIRDRQRCIEYFLNEFSSIESTIQLKCIVNFLMTIVSLKNNSYQEIMEKHIHSHKNIRNIVKIYLQFIRNMQINNKTMGQAVTMMKILFKDKNQFEIQYFVEAEKILLDWSSAFSKETPIELLNQILSLLILILQRTKGTDHQQFHKIIARLSSISQDVQYKKWCALALNFVKKNKAVNENQSQQNVKTKNSILGCEESSKNKE